MVTKLDQLGRSVRNLKQIADDLQTRQVGLRAVSQGIDTTTPGGRLFFHMLTAIAEFEHDLIVERTHDGLAAAQACGRRGPEVQDDAQQDRAGAGDVGRRPPHRAGDRRDVRVSRPTVYRHVNDRGANASSEPASQSRGRWRSWRS